MNNADKPSYPSEYKERVQPDGTGFGPKYRLAYSKGLTKREMFAMAAMQGMIMYAGPTMCEDTVAHDSIVYADALLKALEE